MPCWLGNNPDLIELHHQTSSSQRIEGWHIRSFRRSSRRTAESTKCSLIASWSDVMYWMILVWQLRGQQQQPSSSWHHDCFNNISQSLLLCTFELLLLWLRKWFVWEFCLPVCDLEFASINGFFQAYKRSFVSLFLHLKSTVNMRDIVFKASGRLSGSSWTAEGRAAAAHRCHCFYCVKAAAREPTAQWESPFHIIKMLLASSSCLGCLWGIFQ